MGLLDARGVEFIVEWLLWIATSTLVDNYHEFQATSLNLVGVIPFSKEGWPNLACCWEGCYEHESWPTTCTLTYNSGNLLHMSAPI